MAATLRIALAPQAISDAIEQISNHLAIPVSNGEHREIRTACTVLHQTLRASLQTGDAHIHIPVKNCQPKHDVDPFNKCMFWLKRKQCGGKALLGKHHCFRHRPDGPADLARIANQEGASLLLEDAHCGSSIEELSNTEGDTHGPGLVLATIEEGAEWSSRCVGDSILKAVCFTNSSPKREFFRATESQSSGSDSAPSATTEVSNSDTVDTNKKPCDPPLWRPKRTMQI